MGNNPALFYIPFFIKTVLDPGSNSKQLYSHIKKNAGLEVLRFCKTALRAAS